MGEKEQGKSIGKTKTDVKFKASLREGGKKGGPSRRNEGRGGDHLKKAKARREWKGCRATPACSKKELKPLKPHQYKAERNQSRGKPGMSKKRGELESGGTLKKRN